MPKMTPLQIISMIAIGTGWPLAAVLAARFIQTFGA